MSLVHMVVHNLVWHIVWYIVWFTAKNQIPCMRLWSNKLLTSRLCFYHFTIFYVYLLSNWHYLWPSQCKTSMSPLLTQWRHSGPMSGHNTVERATMWFEIYNSNPKHQGQRCSHRWPGAWPTKAAGSPGWLLTEHHGEYFQISSQINSYFFTQQGKYWYYQ